MSMLLESVHLTEGGNPAATLNLKPLLCGDIHALLEAGTLCPEHCA